MARNQRITGPYSRAFQRGAIGNSVDGRSADGRYIRQLEAELIQHVGGKPSVTEKLAIEQIIKLRLRLDEFEKKFATGIWTDHDSRTFGGLNNAFRLALRDLGHKSAAKPALMTPAEYFSRPQTAA